MLLFIAMQSDIDTPKPWLMTQYNDVIVLFIWPVEDGRGNSALGWAASTSRTSSPIEYVS